MNERALVAPENIVPFAPAPKDGQPNEGDALDGAGRTIMDLLHQAAKTAKDNCGHALGVAHSLSVQLRSAEDRIKDLEAELAHYQDRALRAENWLQRISREIEKKFFDPAEPIAPRVDNRRPQSSAGSRRS